MKKEAQSETTVKGQMERNLKSTKKNATLNVRLLRRVKRHILEEPRRLVMGLVYFHGRPGKTFDGDVGRQQFAPCGTAACIAGWTLALSKKPLVGGWAGMTRAARLLGISPSGDGMDYGRQGHRLFHTHNWPSDYYGRYIRATRASTRAKIAAERIEHFIKTGE